VSPMNVKSNFVSPMNVKSNFVSPMNVKSNFVSPMNVKSKTSYLETCSGNFSYLQHEIQPRNAQKNLPLLDRKQSQNSYIQLSIRWKVIIKLI
jgi:hypothetical protein